MSMHRSSRVVATVIALVVAAATVPVSVIAQASPGPSPAATSPTGAPVSLPSRPRDEDLAAARRVVVSDEPLALDREPDFAGVGEAAAAQVAGMTTSAWRLPALIETFAGDPIPAFELVRDSIAFDAYPGVLRGAEGTLAARAGNAWDRALLLRTLLDEMMLSTRLATGTLDDETALRVARRVLEPVSEPLEDGRAVAAGQVRLGPVTDRATRDYGLLREALGDRVAGMRSLVVDDLAPDLRHHVWVQVRWGSEWLDLDPTLPDAVPGSALTEATETMFEVPDDQVHRVTLRVMAGNLVSGRINEREVLRRTFDAPALTDAQVFLYFQPELEGIGGSIVEALSGAQQWIPVLMVDGETTEGSAFEANHRGTDLFGDPIETSPLTSLRIEVETSLGDETGGLASQALLDRVPASRAGATDLTEEELEPLAADDSGPLVLGAIEQLLVSTGALNPYLQAARRGIAADYVDYLLGNDEDQLAEHSLGDLLYPLAVTNASLVLASEQLSIPSLAEPGRIRGYIAAPRVYLKRSGQDPADPERVAIGTDLLLDDVRVVASDEAAATDGALGAMWYGVLQSALETEDSLGRVGGLDDTSGWLVGTSLAMHQPLTVVSPDDAPTVGSANLREALGTGDLAVVVGDPAAPVAWWTVDPGSGETDARLDPAAGDLSAHAVSPVAEADGRDGLVAIINGGHRPPVVNRGGAGGANTWYANRDGSITRAPRDSGWTPPRDPPGGRPPGGRPPGGQPPGRPPGGQPAGPPASRCGGGSEYVTLVGCVSLPMAWALRIGLSLAVMTIVSEVVWILATAP
jgi:hypothetical protein